jgi:hypothetical protein
MLILRCFFWWTTIKPRDALDGIRTTNSKMVIEELNILNLFVVGVVVDRGFVLGGCNFRIPWSMDGEECPFMKTICFVEVNAIFVTP